MAILGWIILVGIFVGLFCFIWWEDGIDIALQVFCLSAGGFGLILLAVWLINQD